MCSHNGWQLGWRLVKSKTDPTRHYVLVISDISSDKGDGSLYVRLCQYMGQTLKNIWLLRQAAESRIENMIAGVREGDIS